jgi:orotidine-5'-phosphate decarboxylase
MPEPGAGGPGPAPTPFGDRLKAAVARRESQIVLGLDPDPARLWPAAAPAASGRPAEVAGRAVSDHCRRVIEAAGPACVAVKPQLACFERLGAPGWTALVEVVEAARAHGLLVLADGKRGDVPVSAAAYAQALVGETPAPGGAVAGLGADALTASPLLGADSLEPLIAGARARGGGVFALVRTSNPGAGDLLDLELADGGPLWERLARLVASLGEPGPASGLADVGAVTGATAPEHLGRMRELMPATPFLLPGVGAQGGDVRALAPAFAPDRAAGLVTASRSIVGASETAGGEPADAALAEAERLRGLAWSLA